MDLQRLYKCLATLPALRTEKTIEKILKLTKSTEFFRKLTENSRSDALHRACSEVMILKYYQAGQTIIDFGTPADTFHIMISGTAAVFVPPTNKIQVARFQASSPNSPIPVPRSTATDEAMRKVGELTSGQSFGELGLLSNKERSATIKAVSDVVTAVLFKEDFRRVIRPSEEKRLNTVYEFLLTIPVFRAFSKHGLYKLSYYVKSLTLRKGQTLYREGDLARDIFFIRKGEIKISRQIHLESPTQAIGKSRKTVKHIDICVKGEREILGLEEIINGEANRKQLCTCVSGTTDLFYISKEHLLLRIPYTDTWNYLRSQSRDSVLRLNRRFSKNIQVETYKQTLLISASEKTVSNRTKGKAAFSPPVQYRTAVQTPTVTSPRKVLFSPSIVRSILSAKKYSQTARNKKEKPVKPRRTGPPPGFYFKVKDRIREKYSNIL